jgi:hypothetical protein
MPLSDNHHNDSTVVLPEVPFVSVAIAADFLGIAKSTGYDAAKATGQLCEGVPVHRVGRRYLVPTAALRAIAGVVIAP